MKFFTFLVVFSVTLNSCSANNQHTLFSTFYNVLTLHKQNRPEEIENLITIANGIDATGFLSENEYFNEGVRILNSYDIPDSSNYFISEKDGNISVTTYIKLIDSFDTKFVFNANFKVKGEEFLLTSYLAYYFPNPLFANLEDQDANRFKEDSLSNFASPFSLNITWVDSIDSPQGFILIFDKSEIINFVDKYGLANILNAKNMSSSTVDFDIHDFYLPQYGNRSFYIVYNYYLHNKPELQTLEVRFYEHGVKSKPVPLICISDGKYYKYLEVERHSELYKLFIQFLDNLITSEK